MSEPTVDELKRAAASAERRAVELQAWVDDNEAEIEQLRAKVERLEAAAPKDDETLVRAKPVGGREAELQAWIDANEVEIEKLRAQVVELQARPAPKPSGREAELQAWVDDNEVELEKLRAQVAELQARSAPKPSGREAELQAWVDDNEVELEKLRAQVAELQARPAPKSSGREAELQAWVDDNEVELEQLRAKVAELETAVPMRSSPSASSKEAELQQWLDAAEVENDDLRTRVAELEQTAQTLRDVNSRFSDHAQRTSQRDVARLEREVEAARAEGADDRLTELEFSLSGAREAIATLEAERAAAVQQVQRYASRDGAVTEELNRRSKTELENVAREKDAKIAVLQAAVEGREGELKKLEDRLRAWANSEEVLKKEFEALRQAECEAREQLGHVRGERDVLTAEKAAVAHRLEIASNKLEETSRWLADAEGESEALTKQLENARLEHALMAAEVTQLKSAAPPPSAGTAPKAEPAEDDDSLEGFSALRLRRLELQLDAEKVRADTLKRLVDIADKSVATLTDQLELAHGRLADALKRLGLDDPELAETLARLSASSRELLALRKELGAALALPPPPPIDALDDEPPREVDVVSEPMNAVEALADAQAAATKQATDALHGEQRAREQLLGDLQWVKAEVEKLSHVRDDLRGRIATMVQRELKRRGLIASLLETLRKNEVASAARVATVRRLQAAIELAQRNAVKVQTIYFQKQIGSLNRQLETALGKRAAAQKSSGKTKAVPLAVPVR